MAERKSKLPMKLWKITARYTGDGGYWGDNVPGRTAEEAEATAREIMVENGEGNPERIEIVDCDEIDPKVETAKAAVSDLLAFARRVAATSVLGASEAALLRGWFLMRVEAEAVIAKAEGRAVKV